MIEFACLCGQKFSVPENQAGVEMQCDKCRRLVAVPLLSDLASLNSDGTYRLDIPLKDEGRPFENQVRYTPRPAADESFDLRATPEQIMDAGFEATPVELQDQLPPDAPKYDPETGELIRPLAIKPELPPRLQDVPVAAQTLNYANRDTTDGIPVTPARVPIELLMPGNLVVMIVVLVIFLLTQAAGFLVIFGVWTLLPVVLLGAMTIIAHYGCVIEETGPVERDELPTPLRGLSWTEDIWHPFCNVVGALALCYAVPVWVLIKAGIVAGGIPALVLLGLGTVAFPAVVLTTTTSGTLLNLRPARLLGTIREIGWSYAGLVFLWVAAFAVHTAAVIGLAVFLRHLGSMGATIGRLLTPALSYPLLFAGIYLVHLFGWYLGLVYRTHFDRFPWVLQKHTPSMELEQKFARLRQQRAVRKRRDAPPTLPALKRKQEPVPLEPIPLEPQRTEPPPHPRQELQSP